MTAPLPLVVQLGFAGARQLYKPEQHPGLDAPAFEAALQQELMNVLRQLPADLGLGPQHFLCGISQIAVGADSVFTRACQTLQIPQRLFLPQPIDVYLSAESASGNPDFTPAQRAEAEQLLQSPHLIQQRVVSAAPTRNERFHECNLELLRVCSLLVCLVVEDHDIKPGGTRELMLLAHRRKVPVLELKLSIVGSQPQLQSHWHDKDKFQAPALPELLGDVQIDSTAQAPSIASYCAAIDDVGNDGANTLRQHFNRSVRFVIVAHVLATVLSLAVSNRTGSWVPVLMAFELLLLAAGFTLHHHLHKAQAVKRWALCRLVSEIVRSVKAMENFHYYLEPHFVLVQHQPELRHLLRTLNVLHLHSTRDKDPANFAQYRDAYLRDRMTGTGGDNQILYHANKRDLTRRAHTIAQGSFVAASLLAMLVVLVQLLLTGPLHDLDPGQVLLGPLGFASELLPVLAVAGLSLAAASDWEATHYESSALHAYLQRQKLELEGVSSAHECRRMVMEIESRLLGKELNWFNRRSFLGIA